MVDWKMLQSEMKVHAVDFVRKEAKEAAIAITATKVLMLFMI